MGMFAIAKLADALAEIIGCELEMQASAEGTGYVEAAEGWGVEGVETQKMGEWRKAGLEALEQIKEEYITTFTEEYTRLMRLVRPLRALKQAPYLTFSSLVAPRLADDTRRRF